MPYQSALKAKVQAAPDTLGTRLASAVIELDIPAVKVARLLGTSRATVYNWFSGGSVSNAYVGPVTRLIQIIEAAPTASAAWSKACRTFRRHTT